MKDKAILDKFTLTIGLCLLIGFVAGATRADASVAAGGEVSVEYFDIPGMVASIGAVSLVKVESHYLLKCSASNLSGERLTGLQLILFIFDAKGELKEEVSWMEKVNLSGYSGDDFLFEVKIAKRINRNDRVVIAVQQAIGLDSIWSTGKVKDIVQSYVSGEPYLLLKVKRFKNQWDTPPPVRITY